MAKKWYGTTENRFPVDVTAPGATQLPSEPEDAHNWENSLAPNTIAPSAVKEQEIITAIINSRLDMAVMPRMKEEIDMDKIRDLLFSVRDNQIYCPICRCPEFSANEMRSSHFEPCSIGEMCEKLLRLYPREGYVVKWRR